MRESRMKICVTLSCSFPGETGTPLHIMGHVRQLKKNGIDVFVIQFDERRGLHVIRDLFEGIAVYHIPSRLQQLHLLQLLIREKPDIIHCQHGAQKVGSLAAHTDKANSHFPVVGAE